MIDNSYISATSCYNYIMKDPLLDWIKYYKKDNKRIKNTKIDFSSFIMKQGIIFENKVINLISELIGENRIKKINAIEDIYSINKINETISAMKEGYPIIYQGLLINKNNKTFGIPDILIRNDWINKIINNPVDIEIKDTFYYIVLDIKFTSLKLKSDGNYLLNSGSFPAYKAQLYIYNEALKLLQDYTSSKVFILGRKWQYTLLNKKYSNNNCLDRLGMIDYSNEDKKFIELSNKSINWIKELQNKKSKKWNIYNVPLKRIELYPNMNNNNDYPLRGIKRELSEKNDELTSLWMVGSKNRNIGISNGIFKWTDKKCTAKKLGIFGKKIGPILNKIIKINQSKTKIIEPLYIKNNIGNWKEKEDIEYFVDFETFNGSIADINNLPFSNINNLIFMIGVGYIKNRKWKFINFTSDRLTFKEEERICKEFLDFVKDKKCFHWSYAEPNIWKKVDIKYNLNSNINWVDLLKVFKEEPIVIHGCMSFGLKEVSKTMYNLGLIKSTWDLNICNNGQLAMIEAYEANKKAKSLNISIKEIKEFNNIIKYNEIDVKVIYEILYYLRKNHIKLDDSYSNSKKRRKI